MKKIEIDSIPTDFTYTWLFRRIRENVYVKIFTYTWFSTLPTLTTYVTWRWKSGVSCPFSTRPDQRVDPTRGQLWSTPDPFDCISVRPNCVVRIWLMFSSLRVSFTVFYLFCQLMLLLYRQCLLSTVAVHIKSNTTVPHGTPSCRMAMRGIGLMWRKSLNIRISTICWLF